MAEIKNEELLRKIAVVMKQLREKKGVYQMDVIDDTGIHVGRIETAAVNISISSLAALTDYFEIKLSEFFKMVEKVQ
ncbi:helix-turn-helix domain-containing protein [Ferruginibacter sp. HRS2-29]|uniref:helix-turn-helix domain-containing protein n=1 Tax=Ferruginibacter sp. HRS2-29 TaxID=2487334 RepID=UPI0020CE18D6|nr:helix-turn-helix transcriptional regulator [Ferruginibacter sp. HRS2-29]MCP9749491.1 XRE family transcriptional regulator [Ferruginibacter sp. HRS2-29]